MLQFLTPLIAQKRNILLFEIVLNFSLYFPVDCQLGILKYITFSLMSSNSAQL